MSPGPRTHLRLDPRRRHDFVLLPFVIGFSVNPPTLDGRAVAAPPHPQFRPIASSLLLPPATRSWEPHTGSSVHPEASDSQA
ncbi:hypothetical protein G6O67_002342 [Ophiocordyceps sinensis]|uniref:Uncharacterized protein n=1 Tax=Ophiocordyceps sinensis TaxID=72228 RepID=A0A8H4PU03_9HYPO|nr:hypothetical protein G6O67_002342 [Ophiocordyceps sinensis]